MREVIKYGDAVAFIKEYQICFGVVKELTTTTGANGIVETITVENLHGVIDVISPDSAANLEADYPSLGLQELSKLIIEWARETAAYLYATEQSNAIKHPKPARPPALAITVGTEDEKIPF